MRPIFCGNFEYDARQSELERLFRRYGKVERVDMKSGFAFIYMENERDADDAIRGLDRTDFGRKGRRLRVEWTKERGIKRPGASRRSANTRPSKTLFVINFDPYNTRTRDLERHFEPYGKTLSVRIRRNFAFVQFESQEDADRALDATNMSKLVGRVISVEYAARNDDDRGTGYSPDKGHDRSPDGRSYNRRRSPSPHRRERGSPDYGRGSSPGPYRKERTSPDYGRRRSPSPYRRDKASPDYRRESSRSPYGRERAGPETSLSPNRERRSPVNDRGPIRSPYGKERESPDNGRASYCSPYGRERASTENGRAPNRSPFAIERASPENGRGPSHSPYGRVRASLGNGCAPNRSPYGRKSVGPENDQRPSQRRKPVSPENGCGPSYGHYGRKSISPENGRSPSPSIPEPRDSPNYPGAESPMQERYSSRSRSGSPPAEADE